MIKNSRGRIALSVYGNAGRNSTMVLIESVGELRVPPGSFQFRVGSAANSPVDITGIPRYDTVAECNNCHESRIGVAGCPFPASFN
jgi:hypothetical protein